MRFRSTVTSSPTRSRGRLAACPPAGPRARRRRIEADTTGAIQAASRTTPGLGPLQISRRGRARDGARLRPPAGRDLPGAAGQAGRRGARRHKVVVTCWRRHHFTLRRCRSGTAQASSVRDSRDGRQRRTTRSRRCRSPPARTACCRCSRACASRSRARRSRSSRPTATASRCARAHLEAVVARHLDGRARACPDAVRRGEVAGQLRARSQSRSRPVPAWTSSGSGRRPRQAVASWTYPADAALFPTRRRSTRSSRRTRSPSRQRRPRRGAEHADPAGVLGGPGRPRRQARVTTHRRPRPSRPRSSATTSRSRSTPQFLLDGLGALDTTFVWLSFTHPNKPVEFTDQESLDGDDKQEYRYLLVPIRFMVTVPAARADRDAVRTGTVRRARRCTGRVAE